MASHADMEQTLALGLAYLKSEHDIRIEDDLSKPLLDYVHLLHKWNRVYNLTAVRDLNAMVQRHLLDSLVLCRWLPEQTNASDRAADAQVDVIDVGSGAGLPVLPLAIVRPDLQFASIESNGKKTRFQQQALVELDIKNVQVLNQRVQDVCLKALFVTSRAFTAPEAFLSIAEPLCLMAGRVVIMLGHSERLPSTLPAPYFLQELLPIDIPGSQAARHVAVCRRTVD